MNDSDDSQLATKRDVRALERDLKAFILERERRMLRWAAGVLLLYFFALWFLITQLLQHYRP